MTVQECINRFNYLKPHGYDDETLAKWIRSLEERIYEEIISWHEGAEAFKPSPGQDTEQELIIPDAYADVYIYYLQAQADYFNAETGRYNNSMTMFNTALSGFADAFNRAHPPKKREVAYL